MQSGIVGAADANSTTFAGKFSGRVDSN